MASEMDDIDFDHNVLAAPKNKKKLSIERIYQKKSQLEHILLRPDTYIGSVEPVTQAMWVYQEDIGMINKDVTFVPGLYKIFDEILVNAADNKQRDKTMDCIKIEIDPESNKISVWNNGQGIPVVEHQKENMFVPSMIFGQLLTSSNYNDDERKVTGGRNGYGAKLCNIFSTKFTVETATKMYNKHFKQTWYDNMSRCDQPNIKPIKGSDFTCITFHPDLKKFKMTVLEDDIIAIMTRRAYDIAGCTRGVKVFLNNNRLPIKSFKDYINLFIKDQPDVLVAHEISNERWEVAATLSNSGFQQISFVNSIATTKGGRHVDYITEQLTSKVSEFVKKKNKNGKSVKPFQIKSHIWMFVNCSIENPSFDSQTKENMTLQSKNFGSKCQVSDKFINEFMKTGIVESILSWVRFKAEAELEKKCSGKKHSKLKGIPKLEDANDAGTKNSVDCTLILTEGDSAKTLAVSGLGVVGRDKYGVFPLKGKILNVREATHKQILENTEINNIVKIMGLQYKKKYDSADDLKTLRYGRLMIMTDQDQDGSHIKGLLINFIHHNWPSLLRLPFLEEFITPIVKAVKGKEEKCFYSLPEFEEWKVETSNWNKYKIKYYKGLGTSTAKEAKEYFSDMHRHRIKFHYAGTEDDQAIQLAFSKKMIENRKEWLSSGMEERKRRRELGLPEIYLYGKNTTSVTYNDFVNKELILFSNMDNERSIPSAMDGLKPGQRKVLYTCFKRNDKREVKVAQLVGSVAEQSAYHHGEQALAGTIIGLAQNFVGSNNINVLLPVGQFGTRLQGGKDSASPRYIFTMLSPIAKHLFSHFDTPLLNNQYDDNMKIEPEYYVPIIPMVLVNGTEGIGTGWSTKVPNHNPREIVENLLRMLDEEEPVPMSPWYKNYRGTIDKIDSHHYLTSGEIAILNDNQIEITELPIRVWTQAYKENVLEPMLHGTEKIPAFILDYKEYHTDTTVRFVVTLSPENFTQARNQGFHKVFKIQGSIALTSMVLFDNLGCLRRYESSEEILKEFYTVRLALYVRRKDYMIGILSAEALKLRNQARFIIEKIENKVKIENRKKVDLLKTLIDRKYDSDPVKAWKEKQNVEEKNTGSDNENEDQESSSGPDYDYLLGMALWSLTKERVEDLLKKRDEKDQELEDLKKKSPSDLWKIDLSEFLQKLDEIENKEREESAMEPKLMKKGKGKKKIEDEDKPSKFGERVLPKVGEEYKTKWEKKPPKAPREGRNKNKLDNFDEENSNEPNSVSPEKQPKKPKSGLKQSTLNFKSEKTKKQISKTTKTFGKNSSDSSEVLFSDELQSEEEMQEKREIIPRQVSAKAKYFLSDSDSDNNLSVEENSNQNCNPKTTNTANSNASSSVQSDKFIDTHSKTSKDGKKVSKVRKVNEPNTDKASRVLAKQTSDDLENNLKNRTQQREPIKKKLPAKKKLVPPVKPKLKRAFDSDDDDDFVVDVANVEDVVPVKKARNVRQKVTKVYFSSEDEINI